MTGGDPALDQDLRRALLRMVTDVRRVLEEDLWQQLEGTYGIGRDGRMEQADEVATLRADPSRAQDRHAIEAAIRYELGGAGQGALPAAAERFVREVGFTWLNRLAALKVLERRRLVPEALAKGPDSTGCKWIQRLAPEYTRSVPDGGYRLFLECLCDEVARDVGVLFDRSLPHSRLFPSATALRQVLDRLNEEDIEAVWEDEEVLGWIYQYYTPKEHREQIRAESPAPRNSYELAIRNQFYTPDYVVRFLTDNTLGRLWYEMHPNTRLKDLCTYLVLKPGEPVRRRPPRDPREIRVLDPACGSGHFLLYAFDLLAVMYEESGYHREEIPDLILAHNLHGIDIDLRATQIASLALYLKARRYHPGAAVRQIRVACAEPMPGDGEMFEEFAARLQPAALQRMARRLWQEMQLAAEAGSLLKVESDLRRIVAEEAERSRRGLDAPPGQGRLPLSEEDTDAFWREAEERLLAHLREYAEHAQNGRGAARRLFARDGLQGFQFLDLLRQRYDVVLMNPPFGEAPRSVKAYLEKHYPVTKHDLYAAFVERGLELLRPGGYLGAITSRTGFFLSSFQRWREEVLLKKARLLVLADLGAGVLDTAMVETAAYCLEAVS